MNFKFLYAEKRIHDKYFFLVQWSENMRPYMDDIIHYLESLNNTRDIYFIEQTRNNGLTFLQSNKNKDYNDFGKRIINQYNNSFPSLNWKFTSLELSNQ